MTAGRARYLRLEKPAGTKTWQWLNAGICGSLDQKETELKVKARLEGPRKVEVKGTLALVNRAGHIISLEGVSNLSCILKHPRYDFLEIAIRFYATNAAVKGLIT